MSDYYIGIDNGVNGGIVVLNKDYDVIEKIVMPVLGKSKKEYDLDSLSWLLRNYKNAHVVLEKAQPQFRDGKKQSFKTGFGYGAVQGILSALQISYTIVAPKEWQKTVLAGLNTDDTKVASILYCKRRWPKQDWRATDRSKNTHDGLTDAACMAVYGVLNSIQK